MRDLSVAQAAAACGFGCDVSHFAPDAAVRVVTLGGEACPCGGTHVENTADLGGLTVTKLKAKKDTLRVSYVVVQ